MLSVVACAVILSIVGLISAARAADEPAKPDAPKTISATYMITGLHCPMCNQTVEKSLSKAPGVQSIKVDFNTKLAKINFDESKIPAEKVGQLIAATPHMMGPSMHYDGWLALKAPELKDDAAAKIAKDVLGKVAGVKTVNAIPAQHLVEIQFAPEGKATSAQLIDALGQAGIKAENF
jgi:Cu+-exporting ATPase